MQARLRPRRDAPGDGVVGIEVERGGRLRRAKEAVAVVFGEALAGDAIGERRLADAARPGDEPAVVETACGPGAKKVGLRLRLTE